MIARLFARLALLAALAAALPLAAAGPDWTRTVRPTAAGGLQVGNPAARVKLVEVANYTCPHCAHFAQEAAAPLTAQIRSGRLSVEFRPIVGESASLAATVLARCAPPAGFLAVHDALFARQGEWFFQTRAYAERNAGRLAAYAELDQLRAIARGGGIIDVAVAAGLPAARADACFADRQLVDAALAADRAAQQLTDSTPTFLLGGQVYKGFTWAQLSAKLAAAGLK